ncbi:MAG TPA: phosphate acetyltransferase, partial [Phycisphaerales bacterium]|nr:phosphate acetyltransferase [Phycisphaerales bacterium]
MSFMESCREKVRGRNLRIVYPEGVDERAVKAAAQFNSEGLGEAIVLNDVTGRPEFDKFVQNFMELRKHKGCTREQAVECMSQPHFFGAMMVREGLAHGMVSGLRSETKPFLPAFQVIKMRQGFSRASSVFVMCWPDRTFFYADCSVNIDPDSQTLAGIAVATAQTVKAFGLEPRVAFLSFSTRGSAEHARVDKVT